MRYQVTLTAVTGNSLEGARRLGTLKMVAKDRADLEKQALAKLWDAQLDATSSPRFEVEELPRYLIVGAWDHLFADFGNRTVRFIYDYDTERLENLELFHAVGCWVLMSDNSRKDVEDSLKSANEDCLANPSSWGYEASNDLPAWATRVPGTEATETPAAPARTESRAEQHWQHTANAQGWNEASRIIHLESFLRAKGLFAEFAAYAAVAADEENEPV